ncbi:DUF6197 family protein [Winogradskyella vincentii]|uniref:Uncharacterized protein n=1 Tax=Winogradskyella vincentii TaxID=2877122 RepID=A0ABS7Y6X5_9FLAO|nr:hypothetical protein [Winogradskyella vincentii]MCA0154408.1 hypothetical protein [Winogradskyella vincentii]
MIKFFRKIRYDLMKQNKTSKYLKYAIGEIALVMIGILLALQVNEWNKERNRKMSEQVVIEQLITDLSQSQHELEEQKARNLRNARAYSQVLRAYWKTNLPENIQKYVRGGGGSDVYSPVLGTAQSLINSGRLDIISSKMLKSDIVAYVEEVGYRLKDVNRYEESYFRPGIALLKEAIPSSYRSKEFINKSSESFKNDWNYKNNLNWRPAIVEKVPFKTDLQQLFEDKSFFKANQKLFIYHRNISWRYDDILEMTNKLLVKLYLASDQHHELGKKLGDSNYYLVFEAEDLALLKQADALLSNPSKWNKSDDGICEDDSANEKFSLICALRTASQDVLGEWKEDPYSPAIRLVLLKLLEDKNRRYVGNMIREWNNHLDTTFDDVKNLLKESMKIIENQIATND